MNKENDKTTSAEPQAENNLSNKETTPDSPQSDILIPIKFNKEIKNLTVEEASQLAQKGMKYDLVSDVLNTLKNLSAENGKSITQYLNKLKQEHLNKRAKLIEEKCGGDKEFAQHILALEGNVLPSDISGFDELKKNFPQIKSLDDLPETVVESARLKGTLLLDEYLRFLLASQNAAKEAEKQTKQAIKSSVGSQLNKIGRINPETAEFLKGLWQR